MHMHHNVAARSAAARTHRTALVVQRPWRRTQLVCSATASQDQGPPPGCSRYTVELRKPLGIVLEQKDKSGDIFVAAVTPGGNADKTGQFSVGDQLISTSGVTYSRIEEYGGVKVRKGQEIVTLNCLGESFKTVSAAIGSHPASIPVRLTFQRCDPSVAPAP